MQKQSQVKLTNCIKNRARNYAECKFPSQFNNNSDGVSNFLFYVKWASNLFRKKVQRANCLATQSSASKVVLNPLFINNRVNYQFGS